MRGQWAGAMPAFRRGLWPMADGAAIRVSAHRRAAAPTGRTVVRRPPRRTGRRAATGCRTSGSRRGCAAARAKTSAGSAGRRRTTPAARRSVGNHHSAGRARHECQPSARRRRSVRRRRQIAQPVFEVSNSSPAATRMIARKHVANQRWLSINSTRTSATKPSALIRLVEASRSSGRDTERASGTPGTGIRWAVVRPVATIPTLETIPFWLQLLALCC